MPSLTRWFLRAALLYLLLGFTLGALMLANKGILFAPAVWRLLPAHIETLLMGWLLLLATGVAYWILPRFRTERPRSWLVWVTLVLLNIGIACVALAPFLPGSARLSALGRVVESAGVVSFALHAWPRVKPPGV